MIAIHRIKSHQVAAWMLPLGVVAAALLGWMASVLPWYALVGVMTLPIVTWLAVSFPHFGILVTLGLQYQVLPHAYQPVLPVGGGSFNISDLMTMFMAAAVGLRMLMKRQPIFASIGPMVWPLLYLFSCIAISAVYVVFYNPNPALLSEARSNVMWLMLPLLAVSLDTPQRLETFLRGLMVIACIAALYVVIQALTGITIMTGARVESLDSESNTDVIRSIAGPSTYIMIMTLYLLINRSCERPARWLWATPMIGLLLMGLAVQYGRGIWIATTIGLMLSSYIHRGLRGVGLTLGAGLIVVIGFISAVGLFQPRVAEAVIERATGVMDEVQTGGSFGWRKLENAYALDKIQRYPWTGVGIGGEYKDRIVTLIKNSSETSYIHNNYLYYPVKMGLHAALIPFFFAGVFAWLMWRTVHSPERRVEIGLVAAVSGAFLVPMITSYTQPEWIDTSGIATLSTLMGLATVCWRFNRAAR